MNNKRKKALVTGASRGIGRGIAIGLAKDGYDIILHYSGNVEKAYETKAEIEEYGVNVCVVQANFINIEETKAFVKTLDEIDVLVVNASIQYRCNWSEITTQACYEQLNCNFISSLLLIQAVVPYMQKNKWGRIITIGSVQEAKPHPDMLIYSAAKAAQTNMVVSLALQLAKDNITVNNVAPGVIYTDRNLAALSDPEYAKKVTDSIPVGFYGVPEDCVGYVRLLCSEQGRYITGQNLYIDGGKSIQ